MYELLNVQFQGGKQVVSARELHNFLGLQKRFSAWIEQYIKKDNEYFFEDGKDFTTVLTSTLVNNGAERELVDYAITIEMAKEISMMTKNQKGKAARRYFIQCERLATSFYLFYQEQIKDLTTRLDRTEKMIGLRSKTVFDYGKYIKNKMGITKANKDYENVKMVLFAELGVTKWEEIDYSLDVIIKIDEVLEVMKLDRQMTLAG